jgi:hypothetical protein
MSDIVLHGINLQPPVLMEWDVVAWTGLNPGQARVIWVSDDRVTVALLRLDGASWPEVVPYQYVWSMVDSGAWTHEQESPPEFTPLSFLTAKQKELLKTNWTIVGPLLEGHVPEIFEKKARVRLAEEAASTNRVTRRFVMNLLKRAFENGMSRNSVRSPLDRNGRYERKVTPESKKVGRKVDAGKEGVPVDDEIKQCFANSLRLYWSRNRRMSLKAAYDLCMRLYFMDLIGGAPLEGGTHKLKDRFAELGPPSEAQFRYWAPKVVDLELYRRRREKPRIYDQKNRPILGTSLQKVWGPGARFQIDATVLDLYLRSRRVRHQLIGRPTLYVVIDTFSRLIVGIYIGLESPSWMAAMMALANCVEDKVEFCRRHGVEITPDQWPSGMIPAAILGDRGELLSLQSDHMIDFMKIRIENAAAYRGDWKGIVESCFRTLPLEFKSYAPGFIDTDFRQRGVRDYRADAALDLDDLYAIILDLVLYHNNDLVQNDLDRHPQLTEDGVPSIARELWNWGVVKISGTPRMVDPERFRFGLMPQAQASVTDSGVVFEGRYYACPELTPQFEKARRHKPFPICISYDKRRTDAIFVHLRGSEKNYVRAERINRTSGALPDTTAWEEYGALLIDKEIAAKAKEGERLRRADLQARIEARSEKASEREKDALNLSVRSQVVDIRKNRAAELAADRVEESQVFLPSPSEVGGSTSPDDKVIPFPGTTSEPKIPNFVKRMSIRLEDDDE